ncbi:MAG TPA: amylo-alpha-1,6-glucosidase [Opitutaceae bacterium]|jgi:hypothetical protein|nr:amylo-alpha-1,6-glucosidase [Opitutaceae bacterium]
MTTPSSSVRAVACALGLAALSCLPSFAKAPQSGLGYHNKHFSIALSNGQLALSWLGVDSLGNGKVHDNVVRDLDGAGAGYESVFVVNDPAGGRAYFRHVGSSDSSVPEWDFRLHEDQIQVISSWTKERPPEAFTLTFDTSACYATLLGLFDSKGDVRLPAILHLPGYGTIKIESEGNSGSALHYTAGKGWVKVAFPAADEAHPKIAYRWTFGSVYPEVTGTSVDRRYDGFRRNWLNIFQLNPSRRLLSNNTNSDVCGFCYYEYADIALETPPLVGDLRAIDIVRQSLDQILAGTKAYGMPGYGDFPENTSDTAPSLLIAAYDCVQGRDDKAWLAEHYGQLRAIADKMLATDTDKDGLVKYAVSGNSGSWNEGQPRVRPSNWWDTIGFGHEDAYSNALAYRALRAMAVMAQQGHGSDSPRYERAAEKLKAAYFPAFYNPSSGLLAGWRSSDGAIHDYAFTFVNGIAVLYGLVPDDKAAAVMDRLWDKMREVGYTNFRMGLPGNLVPVARKDYAHKDPRYGGGKREDNADGFQVYENGGATACYSYFTIAAFERVGEHERAKQILLPILGAFDAREFEGSGANHMTNDWRRWDGTSEGYEGFLTDNYYTVLAATPLRPLPPLIATH